MPPLYRPAPVTGKRPPLVMPRGLESLIDMGDGIGWPKLLAIPMDAGLYTPLLALQFGYDVPNDASFLAPPGPQC